MTFRSCRLLAVTLGLFAASSCSTNRQAQLEAVAKDWSLVIRASQVLPVYPLTEDLQPGDIFLVQTPVAVQHEAYTRKGFLPLDNHIARLNPDGYATFYQRSFAVGDSDHPLPKTWLKAGEGKSLAWAEAPQAGFPTYSFSVKRGAGFTAALPVQGVPVGLSLLGTDTADGSVTIDKARTYGVDERSLYEQVLAWAVRPDNRAFLRLFAPTTNDTKYLRVVSRVYLTGRLIVSVTDTSSQGLEASGGAPKKLDLLASDTSGDDKAVSTARYTDALTKLNTSLSDALANVDIGGGASKFLPGATLKVVAASSRSITTSETFIDRPLVIGYLGFDCAVGPEGTLGPPMPSWAVIDLQRTPEAVFSSTEERLLRLRKAVEESGRESEILTRVATALRSDFQKTFEDEMKKGRPARAAFGIASDKFLERETDPNGPRRQELVSALTQASATN
jgi:hypothetical protein